jgi:tetratricopeptide (TPR) repeat protein
LPLLAASVVYVIVLVGSAIVLLSFALSKILLRQRSVRRFVRSVRQRLQSAEERGVFAAEETPLERPQKDPRTSAIELQQVRAAMQAAEKALAQEKIEEAERLYIQALTIQPHALDVKAQLAKLYLTTNREAKAEAMYRELLRDRDEVSFHANLGLAYYRQEKYVDACYAYQEALNQDPKNPERCAALGRACIAAQRYTEAIPLLEKASSFLARDTQLLHLLAECYLQLGDREHAEDAYRRINRLEPYDETVKQKLLSLAQA